MVDKKIPERASFEQKPGQEGVFKPERELVYTVDTEGGMNLRFIDDMLDEYKDLAASIGCFKNKWHDSVVAIEGSLHLTPEAFAAFVKEKMLPVEMHGQDGNIHIDACFDDLRITCVILQKPICPAKEDSCPT